MNQNDPTTRPASAGDRHEALTRAARRALGSGLLTTRQLQQVDETVALVELACRNWAIRDPETWAAEIVLLDLGRVGAAMQRLIRHHATVPAFAALFAIYETLDTSRPPSVRNCCTECDGTGCVEARPLIVQVNGEPHQYTQSMPCPYCPDGAARERSSIFSDRDGCP